jgi:hypothetical protein
MRASITLAGSAVAVTQFFPPPGRYWAGCDARPAPTPAPKPMAPCPMLPEAAPLGPVGALVPDPVVAPVPGPPFPPLQRALQFRDVHLVRDAIGVADRST